jgi:hypothetical protein
MSGMVSGMWKWYVEVVCELEYNLRLETVEKRRFMRGRGRIINKHE